MNTQINLNFEGTIYIVDERIVAHIRKLERTKDSYEHELFLNGIDINEVKKKYKL